MHKSIFHPFFIISCVTFPYIFLPYQFSYFFPAIHITFVLFSKQKEGFPVNLRTKIDSYCLLGK